jgi:hypothetical protein
MPPSYLDLAYLGNYVGLLGSMEVWEYNGVFYGYGRFSGKLVTLPDATLGTMFVTF